VRNVLTTTLLFCGPLLAMFSYLNTVAWVYGTTAALPFGTIVIIVVIWALVTFPLTVVGGIMGKNTKVGAAGGVRSGERARTPPFVQHWCTLGARSQGTWQACSPRLTPGRGTRSMPRVCRAAQAEFAAPCRTTKYPREIPPLPWYRQTLPQMLMAGFLPFSAIYIELCEWQDGGARWAGRRCSAPALLLCRRASGCCCAPPCRPADYIFASVWGHKVYTIYSILFIVFIILVVVTAFITIALTYFQLAVEDHRHEAQPGGAQLPPL
jgi:uncharacterized membrane protein